MLEKKHTQKRIENTVSIYKRLFPNEYKTVCDAVIMLRKMQNDEFAALKGEHSAPSAQRALFEMPEKLYQSIYAALDGDELAYYKSKEGARWFITKFPEFSLQRHG